MPTTDDGPRGTRAHALPAAAATLGAALLLRGAWAEGHILGEARSEVYGRIFVTEQVTRWLTGAAAPGRADLLSAPNGQPFWPVDPLLQLVAVPASAALGPERGQVVAAFVLLLLAGWAVARLAMALGARPVAATAAGLAVQLHPFLLRNLDDGVLEVLAVGVGAVAVQETRAFVLRPGPGTALAAGAATLALATASPYYAVYLAAGWAVVGVAWARRHPRGLAGLAAIGALACGLAAAPLLATEGRDGGRLAAAWRGGYALQPAPLEDAEGRRVRLGPDPRTRTRPPPRASDLPAPLQRVVRQAPGGLAALALALVGLTTRAGRRWALLALGVLAVGPGPMLVHRALRLGGPPPRPLIGMLTASLPLVDTLGNPERLLAAWALLAALAGALALSRRPAWAAVVAAAAVGEATLEAPALRASATPGVGDAAALAALPDSTVVFPSGDPPYWHPWVAPKEALALAARGGAAVAWDYGRGGTPADVQAMVRLAEIARVPIGAPARAAALPLPDDATLWSDVPADAVLVLEDRLAASERQRLVRWLDTHAELLARGEDISVWRRPRFDGPAPAAP